MKRRDLLKNLTAMAAVPIGSLIVGNTEKGIAEEVPASHVPGGKYVMFFDPSMIDIDDISEAFIPGMDSISVHCIPVKPVSGKSVSDAIAMFKFGDQLKASEVKATVQNLNWFEDGGIVWTPPEEKKNG